MTVRDGQQLHLHRRQPGGERTGKVLGQNTDKPLNAAEYHTVDHNGTVLLAVRAHIFQLKPLRQLEVQLNGAALPGTTQAIGQVEVQLGAVECAVALVDLKVIAKLSNGVPQGLGSNIPVLLGAHRVLRLGGQFNVILKAKGAVHTVDQLYHALDFVLDLLPGHKDVGIVLGKATHPHQPMQCAGQLMPVHNAQLAHTQRQILVGVHFVLIHQNTAGAVHRLNGKVLVVNNGGVHIFFIVVPVTAALPQLAAEDNGSRDLLIPGSRVDLAPVVDQLVLEDHTLGQEEREPGTFLHNGKQLQLLAQLAVIPLLGLLQHLQVGLQHRRFGECSTVHATEHFILGVTPPVSAGGVG